MNNFTFSGNIGKDARLGSAGGTAVANFSVAVKSGFGQSEKTNWIECAIWGKRAEGALAQYLVKGQQVVVCGELSQEEFKPGEEYGQRLNVRVAEITLVGKSDNAQQRPAQQAPQQQQRPQQQAAPQQQAPTVEREPVLDDFDNDIPF